MTESLSSCPRGHKHKHRGLRAVTARFPGSQCSRGTRTSGDAGGPSGAPDLQTPLRVVPAKPGRGQKWLSFPQALKTNAARPWQQLGAGFATSLWFRRTATSSFCPQQGSVLPRVTHVHRRFITASPARPCAHQHGARGARAAAPSPWHGCQGSFPDGLSTQKWVCFSLHVASLKRFGTRGHYPGVKLFLRLGRHCISARTPLDALPCKEGRWEAAPSAQHRCYRSQQTLSKAWLSTPEHRPRGHGQGDVWGRC